MKALVALILLASLAANVWLVQRNSEMEDILSMQKAIATKQKRLLEVANKDLTEEKQNSFRTVKSAQGLLERTDKLMLETDRLAAENATYRQQLQISTAAKAETPATVSLPTPVPTAEPTPLPMPTSTPSPIPTASNAKKKR